MRKLSALVAFLDRIKATLAFYHYVASDPLRQGLDAGHVAVLLAFVAAAVGLAAVAFERRDVAA